MDYLIVGAGVAGTTAAETLRRLAPDARITVVGAEPLPLYSRVLLPHYVKGKVVREKTFLRTTAQYEAKGIALRLGAAATRLRPGDHELDCADGTTLRYGKLLLATGGQAVGLGIPGADLAGVTPFRTIEDADRIRAAMDGLAGRPAAAIGAGFIGLEFPAFFRKAGAAGHLLVRGPRYWWRLLDEEASGMIEAAIEACGVTIHRDAEPVAIEGDGRVAGVRLKDGRVVPADFVGYGVGLTGAPAFVLDAGIAGSAERGILADATLKTDAPDVWAAGDCADFEDTTVGRRHRLGNWLNAQEQGRYAAEAMAGVATGPFTLVSAYATQVGDLSISFIGDLTAGAGSAWVKRGGAAAGRLGTLHLRDGRLVGAALLNVTTERASLTSLIKGRVPLGGHECDLADPSFDLKRLL